MTLDQMANRFSSEFSGEGEQVFKWFFYQNVCGVQTVGTTALRNKKSQWQMPPGFVNSVFFAQTYSST